MKTLTTSSLASMVMLAVCATQATGNPYGVTQYQYPATAPYGNYQQTVPGYQQPMQGYQPAASNAYSPAYQPSPAAAPYQQAAYGQPMVGQSMQPSTPYANMSPYANPPMQYANPAYTTPTPAPMYAPVAHSPEPIPSPHAAAQPNPSYYDSYGATTTAGKPHGVTGGGQMAPGGNAAYGAAPMNGYGAGPGCYNCNNGVAGTVGGYGAPGYGMSGYGTPGYGGGYGSTGYGRGGGRLTSGWYGSFGGMTLTRNKPNKVVLTSDAIWPAEALMSTTSAHGGWEGGYEITFGHHVADCVRWEVGFWNTSQFKGCAEVWSPGATLITPINLANVAIGVDDLDEFFDNSSAHAVLRKNNLYNLELNVYYRLCCKSACGGRGRSCGHGGCGSCGGACGPCGAGYAGAGYAGGGYAGGGYAGGGYAGGVYSGPSASNYYATVGSGYLTPPQKWNIELLAGVRYFNFDEHIIFAGLEGGANWGDLGGARQAYMFSEVDNHLIGAQIGTLIEYNLTCHWSVYAKPKIGFYGNHAQEYFAVARGDNTDWGVNVVNGDSYPVQSTKNDFSVLAELDLGVRWNFGCHWSAYAGYRMVAISGIALADNQFPAYAADVQGVRHIDTNANLILHGINFGLGFQY